MLNHLSNKLYPELKIIAQAWYGGTCFVVLEAEARESRLG